MEACLPPAVAAVCLFLSLALKMGMYPFFIAMLRAKSFGQDYSARHQVRPREQYGTYFARLPFSRWMISRYTTNNDALACRFSLQPGPVCTLPRKDEYSYFLRRFGIALNYSTNRLRLRCECTCDINSTQAITTKHNKRK